MLVICCLTSNAYHAGYALSTTRLLKTKWPIILKDFWFEDFFLLVTESQRSVFNFSQNEVAKSSTIPSANDVIDICWILFNKPCIVATFFSQQTNELWGVVSTEFGGLRNELETCVSEFPVSDVHYSTRSVFWNLFSFENRQVTFKIRNSRENCSISFQNCLQISHGFNFCHDLSLKVSQLSVFQRRLCS